jgi:release factor glutamine methyltransferase
MSPDVPGTLSHLLNLALQRTRQYNIADQKVKLLLAAIVRLSLPELSLHPDLILSTDQESLLQKGLERLIQHEPLQYILGTADFYGLILQVNENVLIPRPETEGLVEWIIKREKGALRVLDIGTGSGAIALALKHLKPEFKVLGTDISRPALRVARRNASLLHLDVDFRLADLYPSQPRRFDLIVSNPPYISSAEYASLEEEVRLYEPGLALLAARHGLEYYRRILRQAPRHLTQEGKIYLETGETQTQAITAMASSFGFSRAEARRDLAGKNRYLCLSR